MVLDATTDSLEVILSTAHSVRPLQFYVSYNTINVTNSTIVPTKSFGSTNGITSVTMVSAPSSNEVDQVKFLSIYNCDNRQNTVAVRINSSSNFRILFSIQLLSGEQLQYTIADGFKVFNMDGILKTANATVGSAGVKYAVLPNPYSNGTQTITSGTDYAFYLGKADRRYDSVTIQLAVTTALGATITWAEAAIYKGYPEIATNLTLTRCGFVDVSTGTNHGVNATGGKTIVIPIGDGNLSVGEDIWFVIGTVTSGTALVLRSVGAGGVDTIGAGIVQTVTGSFRPSTNSSLSFTLQTAVQPVQVAWFGAINV